MFYKHIFYLILIILVDIILYFALTYGYFHTENHFELQGLSSLGQYQDALMRFNIVILFMHGVITLLSLLYLKNNKKILPLLVIAIINLLFTIKFVYLSVYHNYLSISEINVFVHLKGDIPYADIYYALPLLWPILYLIYISSKLKKITLKKF